MDIKFVDLNRQHLRYREELLAAVEGVLSRGDFILGRAVEDFERSFAAYVGCRYAVGTASGTSALILCARALGLGPGDEAITVPNTFISTAYAVSESGARVVFVDVDEKTQLMSCSKLEAAITPRTKAILPVHLFGQMADMEGILAVAKKDGLAVIEDACQAHGAAQNGRRAGSFGDMAAFSFYPGKNLGAFGDAGLVTTDSETLYRKLILLRNYGSTVKYHHQIKAGNARLDSLQAAVLSAKLGHLDEWNERRRKIAARYIERLRGVGDLVLPFEAPGNRSAHHLFVVRTGKRDALFESLVSQGIQAVMHYPVPIHLQPAYAELGLGPGSFPVAEKLASEILSLPLHPEITDEEADYVAERVRAFFRS